MADNWIEALHGPAKMKEGHFVPPEAYRLNSKPTHGYRGYHKIRMDRPVTLKTDSLSQCVGEKQVTMKEVFQTGSEIENLPQGSRGIWFHICSAQDKAKTPYETHVRKTQKLLDGKGGNPKCRILYYNLNDVIGSYRRTLDISEVEFRIYGTVSSGMGFMYTVLVCPKACREVDEKRFPAMKVGKCYDVIEIVKEESREDKYHLEWTPYSRDPNWMRDHLTFLFYVPVQEEDEPLHYFRYQKMKSCKEREFPMGKLHAQTDLPSPKCEPPSPPYSPPSLQPAPLACYFDTPPPSPPSTPVHKLFKYLSGMDQHQQEKNIQLRRQLRRSVQNDFEIKVAERLRLEKEPQLLRAIINVHDPEFDGIDKTGVRAMSRDLAVEYFGKEMLAKSSLNMGDYNHLDDYDDMKRIQDKVVRKYASSGNDEDIIRLCRKAISTYCSYLRSRAATAHPHDKSPDKFEYYSNHPAKPKACVFKSGCKSPQDLEYDNINTTSVSAMSRDLAKHYFGEQMLAKSSLNRGDYNHLDDYDDMKRIQDMVVRKFALNGNDGDIIRLCRKSISTYCSNLRK